MTYQDPLHRDPIERDPYYEAPDELRLADPQPTAYGFGPFWGFLVILVIFGAIMLFSGGDMRIAQIETAQPPANRITIPAPLP